MENERRDNDGLRRAEGWEREYSKLTGESWGDMEDPKPEADPYTPRIEALRTMPLKEYETAMDTLIAELEDAGKLAEYEAVLTEIDKARDEDLKKLVEGA